MTVIRSMIFAVLLSAWAPATADTALHNINGYTSSDGGIVAFSVLVFDGKGRIVATGDESLLVT